MSLDIPEAQPVSLETSTVHGRPSLSLCRLCFCSFSDFCKTMIGWMISHHSIISIISLSHHSVIHWILTQGCSPSPGTRRQHKGGFRLVPWTHNDITDAHLPSLKLTAKAPENGWLEYYFPIGMAYFQVLLLLVSGRVFVMFGCLSIQHNRAKAF